MGAHSLSQTSKPEPIGFQDHDSFAWFTLTERFPRIIQDVLSDNDLPSLTVQRLLMMAEAPAVQTVEPLTVPMGEAVHWTTFFAEHAGKRFEEVPFFELEAYFYLALLHETGYFQTGSDPFHARKAKDLARLVAELALSPSISSHATDGGDRAARTWQAMMDALYGNAIDLSNPQQAANWNSRAELVAAPSPQDLLGILENSSRVTLVLDNAYGELWYDLQLVRTLLSCFPKLNVTLVFKAHPMFVSDATIADWSALLEFSQTSGAPSAMRETISVLRSHIEEGRLGVETWPVLNSPLPFTAAAFNWEHRANGLVILKGDANYRRAFEDRNWPATAPLAEATSIPVPTLLLRVLKSDCVVGLSAGRVEDLDSRYSDWRHNGRFSMIQYLRS